MNIAIDGPAGAGKSTIAKLAAKKLGFIYVDTGAMYRTLALYMLRNSVNTDDIAEVKKALDEIDIQIKHIDGQQRVILNGEDVSDKIRTEEVGNAASKTSAIPEVRAKLLDLQRNIAATNDVLMDGRDIGTNILPNAEVKIYLTASAQVRAKRRYDELTAKGIEADFEKVKEDIIKRDEQDMNREIAPLKKAEDAYLLDSSDMTIEEVTDKIVSLAKGN